MCLAHLIRLNFITLTGVESKKDKKSALQNTTSLDHSVDVLFQSFLKSGAS
jgi:hypothetical protein